MGVMTAWDWFVLAVVALSVGFGFMRGLVRTVFALAAWLVALLGVPLSMAWVMPSLPPAIPAPLVVVCLFLGLFLGVRMLGNLAAKALQGAGLGGADRLLGAALGVMRAVILILVVALVAHLMGLSQQPSWQLAWSRPLLDQLVRWAEPLLPERLSGVQQT